MVNLHAARPAFRNHKSYELYLCFSISDVWLMRVGHRMELEAGKEEALELRVALDAARAQLRHQEM